ncbi:MAG: tetratricopeptide repeat protein [Deltaproteobacteria bacterium]|nr:tetratricopeptide repeat protein [Deltaproteobacteria bacterium]MBW2119758.1 tetratricopeptide repeat protein [Deltaproteobacteria bacterium]MBW2345364.1 tetratricopeptide repeat protein [Deltaproteobacteria bacterium]
MAKKKKTRKELLKKEDEFLTVSVRAINYFNAHLNQFKIIGVALAVIIVAYIAVHFYMRSINKKGQNAYNAAYYTLTQKTGPDLDPQTLKKSEELFQKLRDEYGMSKAARLALPQIAFMKFVEKKYDEAIALYREFLDEVSGNTEYESLTRLALAACYEAKGDLNAAMETLNFLLKQQDNPFRESAMLSLARLYRLDNKDTKSKEVLKEFVEKYPTSPFLPMARARL